MNSSATQTKLNNMIDVSNSMIKSNQTNPHNSYSHDPLSVIRKIQIHEMADPKIIKMQMQIEKLALNRKDFIYPVESVSSALASQSSFYQTRISNLKISFLGKKYKNLHFIFLLL